MSQEDFIKEAKTLFENEKYKEALSKMEEILKNENSIQPKFDQILFLSEIYAEMDQLENAIKVLEKYQEEQSVKERLLKYQKQYQVEANLNISHPDYLIYKRFENWLKENEVSYNKIKLVYYSHDYRGVHACSTIKQNEIFLSCPEKVIITSLKGQETEVGRKIKEKNVPLDWDYLTYLSVFLLEHKANPNSFWKPYLDVIPKSLSNFPMFYTYEEIKMLKGSTMEEYIKTEIQEIQEEYDLICQFVPEMAQFPCIDYMKMKTLVISRIFLVTINGKEERILVPLADMFNHHYEKIGQSFWTFDQSKNQFTVTSQATIRRGDYICENYGRKPNFRFLFYYGFLIEENLLNSIYIDLNLDISDSLLSEKKHILGIGRVLTSRFTVLNSFAENQNYDFFKAVRFVVFKGTPQELFLLTTGSKTPPIARIQVSDIQMNPFSVENEIAMHDKIKEIAQKYLVGYPTTLEEDLKVLETDKNLTFNIRNIYVLRVSEKKMLHFLINMAEECKSVLQLPVEEAKTIVKGYTNKPYQKYLEDTIVALNKKRKIIS